MQYYPYTRKGRPHQANLLKQEAWRERACPWNIRGKPRYSHAKGARNAAAEIVCGIKRGCEYRATQQFARIANKSAFP